eukprot:3910600-Heterocapsa_arctica.AAC.1
MALIQLIGRWGSLAVLRYIQTSALATQPRVAARLADLPATAAAGGILRVQVPSPDLARAITGPLNDLIQRIRALGITAEQLASARDGAEELPLAIEDVPADLTKCRYVKNVASGCVRQVLMAGPGIAPTLWSTKCELRFSGRSFHFLHALPD